MRLSRIFLFWICLWSLFSFSKNAQASNCSGPNVPITDPTYRYLEKLTAHGLIKTLLVGQRPYSRNEIARQLEEALKNWGQEGALPAPIKDPYVQEILDRLSTDFKTDLDCRRGEENLWRFYTPVVWQEILVAKTPARALLPGSPGVINAPINPLLDYREGRHLVSGFNNAWEAQDSLGLTPHFSFHLHPRFQLQAPQDGTGEQKALIQELYGRALWHNISLLIGRAGKQYGQDQNGGGTLSNNPRPFDQIELTNDTPFRAWLFGPIRLNYFYSDLGPQRRFPHNYLTGWKVSMEPFSFFEFGTSFLTIGGGEGSPHISFLNEVKDIFGARTHKFVNGINVLPTSDHYLNYELRFRIPPLRGTELYSEFVIDDFNKNVFKKSMGYINGIYIPRLDSSGRMDLRIEYKFFNQTLFTHGSYTDGWTLNRHLLGDNLGPQSDGLYVDYRCDLKSNLLLHSFFAFELRDDDTLSTNMEILVDRPEESRYRGGGELRWELKRFILETGLAYEWVHNFNHIVKNPRHNIAWQAKVTFPFTRPHR